MSLFPNQDVITKEFQSWKGFADSLNPQKYKELFNNMLNHATNTLRLLMLREKNHFLQNH
jgi:hypothetical protein